MGRSRDRWVDWGALCVERIEDDVVGALLAARAARTACAVVLSVLRSLEPVVLLCALHWCGVWRAPPASTQQAAVAAQAAVLTAGLTRWLLPSVLRAVEDGWVATTRGSAWRSLLLAAQSLRHAPAAQGADAADVLLARGALALLATAVLADTQGTLVDSGRDALAQLLSLLQPERAPSPQPSADGSRDAPIAEDAAAGGARLRQALSLVLGMLGGGAAAVHLGLVPLPSATAPPSGDCHGTLKAGGAPQRPRSAAESTPE